MPDADSPLSTTSSVVSIVTLVFAVVVTLRLHANALSQIDRDVGLLMRRLTYSEESIS
jgi:hypothetical protein